MALRLPSRPRSPLTFGAIGLAALLAVLAALQYRWAGELSEDELERLRNSSQARAFDFARGFDREITRAFLWFAVSPDKARHEDWSGLVQASERWRSTAPHPRLVKGVFVLLLRDGRDEPLALAPLTGQVEHAAWPAELSRLLERLRSEPAASREGARERPPMFGDPIDEDVPAVIAPIVDVEAAPEGRAPRRQGGFELLGYTVVQLDRDYIHDELLPSLERRFFDPADGFDYWLRVSSSREPRRAIYESRDALATHREAPDASAVILDVRLDPQNRDLIDGADPALASAWRRRLGMDGRAALAGRRPLPLVRRPGGRRADDPGRWQVALWNRAGGLAEVVTIARRRNLAVGFGILVLLGASVALLVATARRAERLARQQMEFVAGVTHELRTPLAVIRSAGENLADGLVADASQVRSYGALVRDEGRRLTEMVEQVLALAGAESGRPPAPPKPVRVRSLVDAVLASCEAEIRAAGVTVDTDVPEGLPSVLGDEAALRRALRNLLDNAVKYAGDSSWIGVRARAGRGERGPEVSLTVQDRGLGVAQEDLPRIFEPFYRGREAVDRQIHGSGLGLSLVRRIAESHGGRITVETGRETGSSFTLRLPVAPEEAPQRASAEQAREEANPAR